MHVYAWEALTRVAVETADAPADAVAVLQKHRAESVDPEHLSAYIYVCKVKKAYDRGGAVKLHVAGPLLSPVIYAVIQVLVFTVHRCQRKTGASPAIWHGAGTTATC